MAYSCTGSPPQPASIRSRKAAGMRTGWSVYRSMIRLSCVLCDILLAPLPVAAPAWGAKEIGPPAVEAPEGRCGPFLLGLPSYGALSLVAVATGST